MRSGITTDDISEITMYKGEQLDSTSKQSNHHAF
jgi:hypothetical protein